MSRSARNIPIYELLNVLIDMIMNGNHYLDMTIDDEFILRLKANKVVGKKKTRKKLENKQEQEHKDENKFPPLPGDVSIMDLM